MLVASWSMVLLAAVVLVIDAYPGALNVYVVMAADSLALVATLCVLLALRPEPRWPTVLIALAVAIRLAWSVAAASGGELARGGSQSLVVALLVAVAWWRLGRPTGSRVDGAALVDTLLVAMGVVGSLCILELQDPLRGPSGLPGQSIALLLTLSVILYGTLVRKPIPTASLMALATLAAVSALALVARMAEVSGSPAADHALLAVGAVVPLGLAAAVLHPSYVHLAQVPRDPQAAVSRWRLVAVLVAGALPVVISSLVTPPSRDTIYLLLLLAGMVVLLAVRSALTESSARLARRAADYAITSDPVTGLRRLGDVDWQGLPEPPKRSVALLSLTGWNSVYQAADLATADRIEQEWTQAVRRQLPPGATLAYAARGVYVAALPLTPEDAYAWAGAVLTGDGKSVDLETGPMPVDVRLGVAPLEADGEAGHLRSVSLALTAMRTVPDGVPIATADLARQQQRSATIAAELLGSDALDKLVLTGLPIVHTVDGQMCGLRIKRAWESASLGSVAENELESVAGRVASLNVQGALDQAVVTRTLARAGLDGLRVVVPVALRTLAHPSFIAAVTTSLDTSPSKDVLLALHVQVSGIESRGATSGELAQAARALQSAGVTVVVDDLAAAAMAIGQHGRMGGIAVGIDAGVVDGIDTDPSRRRIVRMLVELAHDAQSLVIANGVNTREQFEVVAYLGADAAWGDAVGAQAPLDSLPAVNSTLVEPPALPALGAL